MGKLRHAVNAVLRGSTGYMLTKATRGQPSQGVVVSKAERQQMTRLVNRLERSVNKLEKARAQSVPAPKPKAAGLPADFDDETKAIIRQVRGYTMTGQDKIQALITAVRYIEQAKIPGAVVECGVWRGGSMQAVARTLDHCGNHDRELYLFDTYAGMTEPTERDQRMSGDMASDLLEKKDKSHRVWAIATLEDVQDGFKKVPYPADRVHFVEGDVLKTIPDEAPEQIALLRLDTDWYESTKHELEHLYHRLQPGGVLIIDDYGTWQGSKEATDEFLAGLDHPLLLLRAGFGRVAVKPF